MEFTTILFIFVMLGIGFALGGLVFWVDKKYKSGEVTGKRYETSAIIDMDGFYRGKEYRTYFISVAYKVDGYMKGQEVVVAFEVYDKLNIGDFFPVR